MGDNVRILRNTCTFCVPIFFSTESVSLSQPIKAFARPADPILFVRQISISKMATVLKSGLSEKHKRSELLQNCCYNTYYKSVIRYDIVIVAS